jgi:hypothetical protein
MAIEADSITLITAIAGATFGLIGTFLGVLNTWRAFERDRIRLVIIPKVYLTTDSGTLAAERFNEQFETDPIWKAFHTQAKDLCIEVVNRGFLPVTIREVGFITARREAE